MKNKDDGKSFEPTNTVVHTPSDEITLDIIRKVGIKGIYSWLLFTWPGLFVYWPGGYNLVILTFVLYTRIWPSLFQGGIGI